MHRPDHSEASPYYHGYIEQVPQGDICELLADQRRSVREFVGSIPDAISRVGYAPGKWSIRQVVDHVTDTERLFVFRAFWFARGFDSAPAQF